MFLSCLWKDCLLSPTAGEAEPLWAAGPPAAWRGQGKDGCAQHRWPWVPELAADTVPSAGLSCVFILAQTRGCQVIGKFPEPTALVLWLLPQGVCRWLVWGTPATLDSR